ncbi:MAG: hypothetical protein R2851_02615 [Caldilineaceae bacterium]
MLHGTEDLMAFHADDLFGPAAPCGQSADRGRPDAQQRLRTSRPARR